MKADVMNVAIIWTDSLIDADAITDVKEVTYHKYFGEAKQA